MIATPKHTVALLGQNLWPIQPIDPAHVQRLTVALETKRFSVREQATQALNPLGELTAPALQKDLDRKQ